MLKKRYIIKIEIIIAIIFLFAIKINGKNSFKQVYQYDLSDFTNEDGKILSSENTIDKGDYTLKLDYTVDSDTTFYLISNDSVSKEFLSDSERPVILNSSLQYEEYHFCTTDKVKKFQIVINSDENTNLTINNLSVYTNDNAIKRGFLYLLLVFFILDLGIVYYQGDKEKKTLLSCIIGITFLVSLPLFIEGFMQGSDLDFHLLRVEALVQELRQRNFPVRISSIFYGGYGYPSSIMYGDLALYFPAILRLFGLPLYQAFEVFEFSINFLTAATSVLCFRKIFNNDKIGIISGLLYSTMFQHIVATYYIAMIGAFVAYAFYPIIALAIYEIYFGKNEGIKDNIRNAIVLAIGMSGIITSHMLSTEIAIFALIIFAIVYIKKTIKLNTLRTLAFSIIGTILLSAYFIVPMLDYYQNAELTVAINSKFGDPKMIQNEGISLGSFFSFFDCTNDGTIGLALVLVLIIAAILFAKGVLNGDEKILTILAIVFIFLSSRNFPWNYLSRHISLFNKLAQIQYPSRFLPIASTIIVILFGSIMKNGLLEKLSLSTEKGVVIC